MTKKLFYTALIALLALGLASTATAMMHQGQDDDRMQNQSIHENQPMQQIQQQEHMHQEMHEMMQQMQDMMNQMEQMMQEMEQQQSQNGE